MPFPLLPGLSIRTGGELPFVVLGIIGLLWALLWYFLFRDNPEDHPYLSKREKEKIVNTRQQDSKDESISQLTFGRIIESKNMWLAMGQYFCSNFTFFFALTWLFPHIKSTYGLDNLEAGFYAAAPLVFGALGNWFSGGLSDAIYKKG